MNLLEVTTVQGRRMFVNPAHIQAIWSGPGQSTSIVFDLGTRTAERSYIEVKEDVNTVLDHLRRL